MATATTEAPQQTMTAELWFDGGGQMEELQRLSAIKDPAKKKAALEQFNTTNEQFLKLRSADAPGEKAKTHPAVEEAINKAMSRETEWMQDLGKKSDEDLRFRYLERQLDKAVKQGRVHPDTHISEFLESKPDFVDVANKYNRRELERKEVLAPNDRAPGIQRSEMQARVRKPTQPNVGCHRQAQYRQPQNRRGQIQRRAF